MEDDFDLDDAESDYYLPDEGDYDDAAMSEWAYEADLQLRARIVDDHADAVIQKAWASKPGPVDLDQSDAVVRHIGMALEGLSTPARWHHLRRAADLSDEFVGAEPPAVTWHVVEVEWEIGGLLDDGFEVTTEIDLLTVVAHVDRRQLPSAAAMRWLAEHQRTLQDLAQNTAQTWAPGLSGSTPDLVAVKWRSLLGVDGQSSRALPDTDTIVAAMCLLADEAEHRLWIEVPWWVTQRSGRRALTRFCAAAGRGVDVRAVVRHPQHRSVFKPELQQRVVNELQEWGVRVAFDNSTHRKQVIGDDALLQSSSNLTASDDWLGNSGTLLVHADACVEEATNMERRWSDLETVQRMGP